MKNALPVSGCWRYLEWAEPSAADHKPTMAPVRCPVGAQGIVLAVRYVLYLHPARLDDVLATEITDWKRRALAGSCTGLAPGWECVQNNTWPASTARAICVDTAQSARKLSE